MPGATEGSRDYSQEKLDRLFKQNHILSPRNLNVDHLDTNKFNSFDDSVDLSFNADLTPISHSQIENDPKTPHYRKEFAKQNQSFSLSPIPTAVKKNLDANQVTPSSGSSISNLNLHKRSLTNRVLSYTSNETSTPLQTNESQLKLIPNSILKKSINYDRDTSKKLVDLKPELASALNSEGELNPLKASKTVVISPRKEYISIKSHLPKIAKFSSPLTDSINGKSSKHFRSPYVSESSRTPRISRRRITKDSENHNDNDNDWVDENVTKKRKPKRNFWKKFLTSLFDPQLPYILSLYLQLIFNVVIVSILLYFVYSFISTVRADVENKADSIATIILQEIALCSREYIRNNCQPGQRVVALEAKCSEWEACMNRDPATIGRAKIGAETFAEIINGFIKPISWKSMFFLLFITVGSLVLTNAAFGTYRNHSQYEGHNLQNQQQIFQTTQPPQTPHQPSIQYNPALTRYYTPKASSPTNQAIVRHKLRSSRRSKR